MLTLSFGIYLLRVLGLLLALYNLLWSAKYFWAWLTNMLNPVLIYRAIIFLVAFSAFSFHFSVVFLFVQEAAHWWLFFSILTSILVQSVIIVAKNLSTDIRLQRLWAVSPEVELIENILLIKHVDPNKADQILKQIEDETIEALAKDL